MQMGNMMTLTYLTKTEVLEEIWNFLSNTIRILLDYLPVTSTEL